MLNWLISTASAETVWEATEVTVDIPAGATVVSVFFSILPLLLLLMIAAIVIVVVILATGGKKKQQQMMMHQQYAAPVPVPAVEETRSVYATVITKRNPNGDEYYLGFETEDRQRIEFRVSGPQYGVTLEGDKGMLKLCGNMFAGFDRV